MQLMTFSRSDCFKTCRRKHWFAYELGVRPVEDARALRMGSIYHASLEALAKGKEFNEVIDLIRKRYADLPEAFDPQEWLYECETIERLLCGYVWRWQEHRLTYVAKELWFQLPLTNPETGAASREWQWAGKIDGIVKLEDGRLAVVEHKLLSEELDDNSPLWRRLRVDHQISLYVVAARRLGYAVDAVLYDVARKPTVKPTPVPVTDENGMKVVMDAEGTRIFTKSGEPRQTASSKDGWALVTRPMNPDEWGAKLTADIAIRPEFYFARREIPRMDQDLDECMQELWDVQKTMRDAQINDRHYRTCNKDTCSFCSYFDLCTTGYKADYPLPESFVKINDIHPELRVKNEHADTTGSASEENSSCATASA